MADKLYNAFQQEIELTNEQQACLKYTGDRTLMVKGYAGAGKSVVLMTIAKKYLEKYGHTQKNKVAFFTFQNTLVSTTKELLDANGDDEGIVVSTVNSYIKSIYDDLVVSKKAPKQKYPNAKAKNNDKDKRIKNVEIAVNKHRAKYGKHRFHDIPYEFWLDEFDWMKDMNIGMTDIDAYYMYKRKGRGNRYRFRTTEYAVAFEIYTYYLAHQAATGQGDWADQPMFLIRNRHLISDKFKFDHILIDEAQDLSLAQMMVLMLLYRDGGDMIVAMDANQKIHGKHWTPKLLGIETTTKKLTKSMRTTLEIDNLAESIRSKNDAKLEMDDKSLRAVPERTGDKPKLVHLDDQASERKYVVNLIKAYMKTNPNITIGVIASKNNQINTYSDWLTSADIQHEQVRKDSTFSMVTPGVKVVSAFGAKGLEFNVVIIPMFAEGYFPYKYTSDDKDEMEQFMIKMRNLVYVSMTRAKNILIITWWGNKGSRFIKEMDPQSYDFEGVPFEIQDFPILFDGDDNGDVGDSGDGETPPPEPDGDSISTLVQFLKQRGLEVIDNRGKDGALWVLAGKEIDSILKETRKQYGALWIYKENGGRAVGNRSCWFTKSKK